MSLTTTYIDEHGNEQTRNKVDVAVSRIRSTWESSDRQPLWVSFSGGKDSVVLLDLVKRAGVPYEAHYNITSVDPPELVRFIKQFKDVSMDHPRDSKGDFLTMWNLIARRRTPPTRMIRYCCQYLKERTASRRIACTGVRWAESARRKNGWGVFNFHGKRAQKKANELGVDYEENGKLRFSVNYDELSDLQEDLYDELGYEVNEKSVALNNDNSSVRKLIEHCSVKAKTILNPIIDWEDEDIWDYILNEGIPYCSLYKQGGGQETRLGCIACPLKSDKARLRDFDLYPKYKELYLSAFDKMLKERRVRQMETLLWDTAQDVMDWWIDPNKVYLKKRNLSSDTEKGITLKRRRLREQRREADPPDNSVSTKEDE